MKHSIHTVISSVLQ